MSDPMARQAATLAALDRLIEAEESATEAPWRMHDTDLGSLGGHTATVLSGAGNATDLRAWLPSRPGQPWDTARNVWNDASLIAALRNDAARSLRGRRSILVRHAPEWGGTVFHRPRWLCSADHDGLIAWEDCPDWRDAAAGLPLDERKAEEGA